MKSHGASGTLPYRITPLNPDSTRTDQPCVAGTGEINLATVTHTDGAAVSGVSATLSVDGQDARDWDMENFAFEVWNPVVVDTGTCDYAEPEKWARLLAFHMHRTATGEGETIIEMIPRSGAFYAISTTPPYQD